MNPLLDTLAAELENLKAQGHTAVALEPLISYVEGLQKSAAASDPEGERYRMRIDFEAQIERHRAEVASNLELFKSVIEAGLSALRTFSLINGAAAVAILAFLGDVLTNPTSPGLRTVPAMSGSMGSFAVGVLLAAVGFAARYFSQAYYGGNFTDDGQKARQWGNRWRNAAI